MKKLVLMASVFLLFFAGECKAQELKMPEECSAVEAWTQNVVYAPKGMHEPEKLKVARQSVEAILTDEKTAAVFGKPRSNWDANDKQNIWKHLGDCGRNLHNNESSKKLKFTMNIMGSSEDWGTRTKKPH